LSEQEQQHITSIEPNILEITEEELRSVFGGSNNRSEYTFVPSRNNPTAGTYFDKRGRAVGFSVGDCSKGPC
jgi:hypothetical protein